MIVIRTIVTALVAISVVLLPAAATVAVSIPSVEMSVGGHDRMPCCPSSESHDSFRSIACALKCMALNGAVFPVIAVAVPPSTDGCLQAFADDTLQGLVSTPPTHPPPV